MNLEQYNAQKAAEDAEWFIGANESSMRILPVHTFSDRFRIDAVQGGVLSVMSPLRSEAPRIALAVLEASGIVPVDHSNVGCMEGSPEAIEEITFWLTGYVKSVERDAQEAAAREALEREALELCNIFHHQASTSWENLSEHAKENWIRVARHAQELNAKDSR